MTGPSLQSPTLVDTQLSSDETYNNALLSHINILDNIWKGVIQTDQHKIIYYTNSCL